MVEYLHYALTEIGILHVFLHAQVVYTSLYMLQNIIEPREHPLAES